MNIVVLKHETKFADNSLQVVIFKRTVHHGNYLKWTFTMRDRESYLCNVASVENLQETWHGLVADVLGFGTFDIPEIRQAFVPKNIEHEVKTNCELKMIKTKEWIIYEDGGMVGSRLHSERLLLGRVGEKGKREKRPTSDDEEEELSASEV